MNQTSLIKIKKYKRMKNRTTKKSFKTPLLTMGKSFAMLAILLVFLPMSVLTQNRFAPWCNWIDNSNGGSATRWMSAIEEVTIFQGDIPIFKKAPDGYQYGGANYADHGHVLNSTSNAITLVAGATYKLEISLSSTMNYNSSLWGAWLDYNNNKAFESPEWLIDGQRIQNNHTSGGGPGEKKFINFTIPCNVSVGLTRLRIKCAYQWSNLAAGNGCANNNQNLYGESEDIHVNIVQPTILAADFIVPKVIWSGAPSVVFNSNPNQATYKWDKGNGVDYIGNDYLTIFPTGGNYNVTLIAENCIGTTSITKTVRVTDIPQKPEADFVTSRNRLIEGDEFTLYDQTLYGPFKWDWEITNFDIPGYSMGNSGILGGKQWDGSYFHPVFAINAVGEFNVSLTSTNLLGSNKKNKARYIVVEPFADFLLGIGVTQTELGSGRILDGGGADKNYPSGPIDGARSKNRLQIKPCGAESISLTIEKLLLGNAEHALYVWDGDDTMGVALHPPGGFKTANITVPMKVVAQSGSMFIEFDASGTGSNEGLEARFETTFGTTNAPVPYFEQEFPSQAYSKAEVFFKGGVSNLFGFSEVKWKVDNFEVAPSLINGDVMSYTFSESGSYEVCLEVTSCAGDSSFCRTINVVDPVGRTTLDFLASDDRPELGQNVVLNGITDKANRFQWQIVPATYSINSGNLLGKYPNVSFNESGSYSISLRAWNTFDSASSVRFLVKNNYVIVINPCTPLAFEASEDVSNNRLRLFDWNNQVIFSHSSPGGQSYRSFLQGANPLVNLTFGATYTIEMFRETTADTVSRAIYIDFNSNGEFESNELVLHEVKTRNQTATSTFTVPSLVDAYNGTTRLRTIVTYGSTSELDACGPGVLAEYKDYRVSLNQNGVLPVITLNGMDTVDLEVNASYSDAGATAFDVIDGDLTNDIKVQTNLDLSQPGIYFTRYDVSNSSSVNALSVFRQILVSADRTAPIITLTGAQIDTIEVNSGAYIDPMGVAIDNIDGDISSEIVVEGMVDHTELGVYTLTYRATDVQGNTGSASRTVYVLDRTAPEFVFTTGEQLQLGEFWYDQTRAIDNYWPENGLDFRIEFGANGPVRWDVVGQYPITYRATDGSGNSRVVNRVYEVGDFVAPTISLNTADTVIHNVNTPYVRVEPFIFDNFYEVSLLTVNFTTDVNPNMLGMYEEKYTVSDPSNNTTERTRFVKVVDVQSPVISGSNFCTKVGIDFNTMVDLIILDNYYTQSELLPLVEIVYSNVDVWFEGKYSMVYQVTDPSGNRSNFYTRNIEVSESCELITSVDNVTPGTVNFTLYPNPTSGKFKVDLTNLISDVEKVEVLNSIGVIVMTIEVEPNTNGEIDIDLSGEASGIFLVRVTNKSGTTSTKRVVVTR